MIRFLLLLSVLLCTFLQVQAGTAVKKAGQVILNNYMQTTKWDFDTSGTPSKTGAAAGTNTDTLILMGLDTSSWFSTTTLRVKGIQAGTGDALPDSMKYCVLAKDDAADAITLRSELQYRFRSTGTWITFGGNGDLALAGAGVPVWSCFSRQFLPNMDYQIIVHPTTVTDSASVKMVVAFPIRK